MTGESMSQDSALPTDRWDVIIVGAGPAGLSAALVLGRCCRKVLLCDKGTPRSWASHAMHGYVSRDGVPPTEFRAIALAEICSISDRHGARRGSRVGSAQPRERLRRAVGRWSGSQVAEIVTRDGVLDELPPLPDIEQFFGTSVFPCPYCDGWELRGKPIAVYGRGKRAFEMARSMTAWSRDILVCTDGPTGLSRAERDALASNGIRIEAARILRLEGPDGKLERIIFRGERAVERSAMFFNLPTHPQSELARTLGCRDHLIRWHSLRPVRSDERAGSVRGGKYPARRSVVDRRRGRRSQVGVQDQSLADLEDFNGRAGSAAVVEHPGPENAGAHWACMTRVAGPGRPDSASIQSALTQPSRPRSAIAGAPCSSSFSRASGAFSAVGPTVSAE